MTKEEKAAEMARRKEERKQVRSAYLFFFRCAPSAVRVVVLMMRVVGS